MDRKSIRSKAFSIANNVRVWLLVIVIIVLMAFVNDKFLTVNDIINVLRQVCMVTICTLSVPFVVLDGEIDLSSGMTATFAGCNTALLITRLGVPLIPAILLAALLGAAVGTVSGCIITFWKIPSFIGTLGVQYTIQGLILIIINSMPATGLPEGFLFLGRGYVANIIPVPVIIMLVLFAIGTFLLKYTTFGHSMIVVGENAEAAALSGPKVIQIKVLMFAICGFCSAYADIMMTAGLSPGQPGSGSDMALQALAAVCIGGTLEDSMLNILVGTLAWGFVDNGLNLLGVNAYWQKIVLGTVIIVVILFDSIRTKVSTVG